MRLPGTRIAFSRRLTRKALFKLPAYRATTGLSLATRAIRGLSQERRAHPRDILGRHSGRLEVTPQRPVVLFDRSAGGVQVVLPHAEHLVAQPRLGEGDDLRRLRSIADRLHDAVAQLWHGVIAVQKVGENRVAVDADRPEHRRHREPRAVLTGETVRDHRPPFGKQRTDLPHSALRSTKRRNPQILLRHEPSGGQRALSTGGWLAHHLLNRGLV